MPGGGVPERKLKFAKPPEQLRAGEGRRPSGVVPPGSTETYSSPRADGTRASRPHHCLQALPAAGPFKLGASAAARWLPAARDARDRTSCPQGMQELRAFSCPSITPRVTTPNPFSPNNPCFPSSPLCFLTVSISRNRRSRYPGTRCA